MQSDGLKPAGLLSTLLLAAGLIQAVPVHAVDLMSPLKGLFSSDEGIVIWQQPGEFVKIVEQDWDYKKRRAPANAHPVQLQAADLAVVLVSLRTEGDNPRPLLSADKAGLLAPELTDALDRAGPQQDVVFAVTGSDQQSGISAGRSTAGRLFMDEGGRLNIIFGDVHSETEPGDDHLNFYAKPKRAGKRSKWLDRDIRLATGTGITHKEGPNGTRPDWLQIDIPATVAAYQGPRIEVAVATPPTPAPPVKVVESDQREKQQMQAEISRLRQELNETRESVTPSEPETAEANGVSAPEPPPGAETDTSIRERLRTLKSLYEEQLITEQEYAAKRRELLDRL